MHKYPDFYSALLGKTTIGTLLAYVVIAYICAFASMLIDVSNRDISSANTPVKTSWKFFTMANLARLIANFLLIPIFVRIGVEYLDGLIMTLTAIGIGAGFDRLAMLLKKIGILSTDNLASKAAAKIAPNDLTVTPPAPKP